MTPPSSQPKRQLPSLPFLKQVLRPAPFSLNGVERRLRTAHTIYDLRRIAKRRIPQGPFEYADGAADDEITVRRNRKSYRDIVFTPAALQDVSRVDTSVEVLGARAPLPFGFAPTGFTRMLHTAGEHAVWNAASRAGITYALSSFGTTHYSDLVKTGDPSRAWFQLYLLRDFQKNLSLLDELREAGCTTLVITVDTAVPGNRVRDLRNGMTFPPQLTPKTLINASVRPEWWINLLTTPPLSFAYGDGSFSRTALTDLIDPEVTWDDVENIRSAWKGKLIIKGIQSPQDARMAVSVGADAVVLSNHGGRQLDRSAAPLTVLPSVVQELQGEAAIMIDSGVRSGSDIVGALALGVDYVLLGRAYLYGLMAAGEAGVDHAIGILRAEVQRTMGLLGVQKVSELSAEHVTVA